MFLIVVIVSNWLLLCSCSSASDETKAVVVAEPQVVTVLTPTPKKQEVQAPVGTGTGKYAAVVYDYWAHNNKELTIRAGEKVLVSNSNMESCCFAGL